MTRRCFAQSSLADAFVRAYSTPGGFLEDLLKTIEWSAFDVLFAQINANTKGAPGYVRAIEQRHGQRIACLEEIAFHNGWIDSDDLRAAAAKFQKSDYGAYLLGVPREAR
jgi:hypothetical protein